MANAGAVPDLATVVQHITNANPASMSTLAQSLKSFAPEEQRDAILGGLLPGAQDPLAILDPRANTLGYLYILSARLGGGNAAAPVDAAVVEAFCRDFDPEQARLAPHRVTKLAREMLRWAEGLNRLKLTIAPLHNLLTRYPPDISYLTPVHATFVQACLKAQHTPPTLLRPILSTPITQISTSLFPDLHYNDNLIYHYIGGIIFGLWKDWSSAEEFFEICVTSPAQMPSALQWDALKKYVLVQCIYRGKTRSLPKYVHGTLSRLLKNSPYGAFQRHYPRAMSQLRELIQKEGETFSGDKNQGLINQALEAAPRWNIKRLTDTYLSLSLSEIGKEIGINSESAVRAMVLSMIERGEITATVGANNSVAFEDAPVSVSKAAVDAALREAQVQSDMLAALEREIGVSKEFLTKVMKARDDDRYGPGGGGGDGDEMMFGAGMSNWADDAAFS